MPHLLIEEIDWDAEGQTLKECRLPGTVVLLDFPKNADPDNAGVYEAISVALSENFGFNHNGFTVNRLNECYDTHAGGGFYPDYLAVIRCPLSLKWAGLLPLLTKSGFMWYKNQSTDRVDAECIDRILPYDNGVMPGFTVHYNGKAVLISTTATVSEIEVPANPDTEWIRVHWEDISDKR